ncbi:MAG: glycosyltransferase family 4 protein [Flavobacteriales bacterium]|nr:glycosyltransferase family 4 protein [Flavobacteriales bacterium]
MKTFAYFVEPALYSIDLSVNIYDKMNIGYCFIKDNTYSKSSFNKNLVYLSTFSFFSRILFILKQHKLNDNLIINGYNNLPFIISFLANLFFLKKVNIAIESDTQYQIPKNYLKRFVKYLYLSIIFRNKNIFGFAGGSNSHMLLFKKYGMNTERIFLMPLMVNNSRFFTKKKVFPKIFTFLYVGRLIKRKNVESLINVFNKKFSENKVVLKIIGSGREESSLRNKYSSSKVIFLGPLFENELIKEYHSASCFVIPSLFEPWGLVVNEALSASLPVISLENIGANFDLIKSKNTGEIASDMNTFGDIMVKFLIDKKILTEYSNNAKYTMQNIWNYNYYQSCLIKALKKIR